MAEPEWTEELAEPKKSGVPMWVWGCGGCGLIAMIAVLVALGMGIAKVRDAIDPDVVWPKVDEVLPFDERPVGYQAMGTTFGDVGVYGVWSEERAVGAALILTDRGDDAELDEVFSGDGLEQADQFGVGNVKEVVPVTLTIDGRECRALRFRAGEVQFEMSGQGKRSADSWILLVDLSREGDAKFRMLEVFDFRELRDAANEDGEGGEAEGADAGEVDHQAAAQELIDLFLEPFDPWE